MGINRVSKRGKVHIEVRRRWPDGNEFRRFMPNMTVAKQVKARIEVAIADGAWRKLKDELTETTVQAEEATIRAFSEVFMEQHCKVRMRSWKRYELSFKTLNQKLGEIRIKDFRRLHLHKYVQWRSKHVKANTVNRDIACIKKMCSFALEMGVSEQHPLVRFPLLPVQEKAFRVLTLEEFRHLVQAMGEPSLRAMVVVMGETAIRKKEAIKLLWDRVDFGQHILTIERTKSRKVREIPLSSFACEALQGQVRYLDSSYVFVNTRTGNPWLSPEKAFKKGCEKAGLKWVGFHDLRRFRATQWVRSGIDVRTVKELLGHTDIKTTLRYARFVKSALREVREAQEVEEQQLQKPG